MSPGPRQELYRQEPISGRVRGVTFAEALYRQDSFPPSGAGEIGPSEGQEMDRSAHGPSSGRLVVKQQVTLRESQPSGPNRSGVHARVVSVWLPSSTWVGLSASRAQLRDTHQCLISVPSEGPRRPVTLLSYLTTESSLWNSGKA